MPKPNTQIIIDSIIKEIEIGSNWKSASSVICAKFRFSEKTFDKYWKMANEEHRVAQQAIKSKLVDIDTQAAIDARKREIIAIEERKELLSNIATGKVKVKRPFVIGGKIMEYPEDPSHNDRIKALAELNKMDGSYQPQKIEAELTGSVKTVIQLFEDQPPLIE